MAEGFKRRRLYRWFILCRLGDNSNPQSGGMKRDQSCKPSFVQQGRDFGHESTTQRIELRALNFRLSLRSNELRLHHAPSHPDRQGSTNPVLQVMANAGLEGPFYNRDRRHSMADTREPRRTFDTTTFETAKGQRLLAPPVATRWLRPALRRRSGILRQVAQSLWRTLGRWDGSTVGVSINSLQTTGTDEKLLRNSSPLSENQNQDQTKDVH